MVSRTVTYVDFDGESKKKTLYFHLTKAEFVKMERNSNPLSKRIKECVDENGKPKDIEKMLEVIETILLAAYGVREGEGFRKTKELTEQFVSSEEYSQLFMDMLENPNIIVEIFKGITPMMENAVAPIPPASDLRLAPPQTIVNNVNSASKEDIEKAVREVLVGMQNANATSIVE